MARFVARRAQDKNHRECDGHQTNVSTFQGQARANARVFGAHALTRRARRDCGAPCQRAAAPRGLKPVPPKALQRLNSDLRQRSTAKFEVTAADKLSGFAPSRRLKTPADYSAVRHAHARQSMRAARQLMAVTAAWTDVVVSAQDAGRVRFGVTVGKRNARRAVDRVLVKRIVREACRRCAAAFEGCATEASVRIDISMRLKSPLADPQGPPLAMRKWRRQIRAEADGLLQDVLMQLAQRLAAVDGEKT